MSRICDSVIGMRVVTPLGRIAKVVGQAIDVRDAKPRVRLQYLDPALPEVELQPKDLRGYEGPPVLFPDELSALAGQYGGRPT